MFTQDQLVRWFRSAKLRDRTVRDVCRRANANIEFMDKLDLIRCGPSRAIKALIFTEHAYQHIPRLYPRKP